MSNKIDISVADTHHIRDRCLCLHAQRAARSLARRFDHALRPVGLNNGQFSLMMALNRPEAPAMGEVAALLAMDRTTLTAKLKPLVRRGLVCVSVDAADKRGRRLCLTAKGEALLAAAVPVWTAVHAEVERRLAGDADRVRAGFRALA